MPRRHILLGFHEVGGHYVSLAAEMRTLGRSVDRLLLVGDPSRHPDSCSARGLDWIGRLHQRVPLRPGWARALILAALLPLRALLSIAIALRYQAVVIAYGMTPTHPAFDLCLWRLARLRIVVVFHGSDIRPPWLDGASLHDRDLAHTPVTLSRRLAGLIERPTDFAARLAATSRQRRLRARCAGAWADAIVSWAGNDHYLDRPYHHFAGIGRCQPAAAAYHVDSAGSTRPVLVHCPSSPKIKGTEFVDASLASVMASNPNVAYHRISGVSNAAALSVMASATLVIDQVFSDIAMPGVAAEAAWLGVPAVVGGYAEPHPAELAMDPPSLRCRPPELTSLIHRLLADPQALRQQGCRAKAWIERHWPPSAVAERWLAIVDGRCHDTPLDPRASRGNHGCGVRPAEAARALRLLAGTMGASSWLAGARRRGTGRGSADQHAVSPCAELRG